MTAAVIRLERAAVKISARLAELEVRLSDEPALWPEFAQLAAALAVIMPALRPEARGGLLTTSELAAKLGVSSRTLLRRRKAGALTPAVELGKRGRAALRWNGTEVPR
jgi:Transcriptional regulator, AbiEi antitoxin